MSTTRGQHLVGKVLGGCLLEELLGYGGSGAVFLAQQRTPERKVAVKVFLQRSTMDAQMRKDFYNRFLREAEAASKLDHPNILPIYSYGEQNGLPYIIMPYMPGGTLYDYVVKHGSLSLSEAYGYLDQIASALDYAHEHGCVHCDVKPANILLDGAGHVMLSDFGIARILQPNEATGHLSTKAPAALMGTPHYISPEQALGQPLDGSSDVYSLGVTLFFLLNGHPPFRADNAIALSLLHVHEVQPLLGLERVDVSPSMDCVLHKALAKLPSERFQTAGEFSAAFAQAMVVSEDGDEAHERVEGWGRRNGMDRRLISDSGSQPDLVVSKPIVRIKSVLLRPFVLPRIIVAVALLLMLIVGVAVTAGVITSQVATGFPGVQATAPVGISNGVDALTNRDNWITSSTFFFVGNQYHIQNKSVQDVALALYANHQFGDFHLTVNTSEIHGSQDGADYYGIVFRSAADQSRYYLFEVVAWGGGQYAFLRYDGQWKTLANGSVSSLLTGLGQINIISIEAKGNTFTFSINKIAVGTPVTDPSKSALTSGEIGLYVEERRAEVAFSYLYTSPLQ